MTYDPREHSARCDECPLRGTIVVPPEGDENAGYVIVSDAPGMADVTHERPFMGASGAKLTEVLSRAGLTRASAWLTSALLCRPEVPGESGARRYDLKLYLAWLRKENVRRKKEARANKTTPDLLVSPFECCYPRLRGELHRAERAAKAKGQVNGAVVVPVGNFALGSVMGNPGQAQGIMKWRGSVIPTDPQDL